MYIYKITNLVNNKIYIGQTIQTIRIRFNQHCTNKTMLIGNAIKKYGRENFKIEVINEFTTIDELNYFEEYYISLFNSLVPHGYNISSGGLNKFHHQSTKDKLSKLQMGKKYTLNYKNKTSSSLFHGVIRDDYVFVAYCKNHRITRSKSEKWCAYMYDKYCIENNLIERELNGINYEEAYNDYLQYYNENGVLKNKTSKYKYVSYDKTTSRYIAKIFLDNKTKFIGYFKTEIEAVKAVNKFILDNNIDRPLQEI